MLKGTLLKFVIRPADAIQLPHHQNCLPDFNGSISVYHLHETGLFDVVFQPHDPSALIQGASLEGTRTARCAHWLLETKCLGLLLDREEKRLLYLTAALISYRAGTYLDKKQRVCSQPGFIVLESIKFPTKDSKSTSSILEAVEEFKGLAKDPAAVTRKALGLALRKPAEHWKISLVLAAAHEVSPLLENIDPKEPVRIAKEATAVCDRYKQLADSVSSFELLESWNEKPLVNGKDIAILLNVQLGPLVGQIIHNLLDWQLENPKATTEDAKVWLLAQEQKK